MELAEAEAWIKGPDAAELGVSDELAMLVADSRQAIDAAMQEKERAAEQLRATQRGAGDRAGGSAAGDGCGRRILLQCPERSTQCQ